QKDTAFGGEASRAIDGNKNGDYSEGGQSHTRENTMRPWWQLDLGADVPIENITIYNRTDGEFAKRLDGFTLRVLDSNRKEVFSQQRIAAPDPSKTIVLGKGDPVIAVRQAAMNALTYIRGQESKTFQSIAPFIASEQDRAAAIRALERIPRAEWPQDQARPLLDSLMAYVRKLPTADRTSADA